MREMSVTEQRYKAVQGVLADGRTVSEVASQWEVSRRTLHRWLARYEGGGLEGLGDGSHRPAHCPHQMPAGVEVLVLEMRRAHPYWGARRIAFELAKRDPKSPQPPRVSWEVHAGVSGCAATG
jgi:transposase